MIFSGERNVSLKSFALGTDLKASWSNASQGLLGYVTGVKTAEIELSTILMKFP